MHFVLLNLCYLFLVLTFLALLIAGILHPLIENCLYKYLRFATLARLRYTRDTCFQSAGSAAVGSLAAFILALLIGGDINAH